MHTDASLPTGEMLRLVMRHWVTGVAVVTSTMGVLSHGMTVNSFVSISLDPPLVTVTMNNKTRTLALILQSKIFGVTILGQSQQYQAELFSGSHQPSDDRIHAVDTFTLSTGAPLLAGGVSFLDCRLVHQHEMRNSTLLIGEVQEGRIADDPQPPLIYFKRVFTSLQDP